MKIRDYKGSIRTAPASVEMPNTTTTRPEDPELLTLVNAAAFGVPVEPAWSVDVLALAPVPDPISCALFTNVTPGVTTIPMKLELSSDSMVSVSMCRSIVDAVTDGNWPLIVRPWYVYVMSTKVYASLSRII